MANKSQAGMALYTAWRRAGLNDNQARIMMAETGRENAWNLNTIFVGHVEPVDIGKANPRMNFGLISWNGTRRTNLISFLSARGLWQNGRAVQSQATLDAMAQFAVHEIASDPHYSQTKKAFLQNPNVDYGTGTKVLGNNYIKWRYYDPKYSSGHANRDNYYRQINGLLGGGQSINMPAQQSYQQPTFNKNNLFFIGDSIAHGYRTSNSGQGITKGGMNTTWIRGQLDSLLAKNPNALKGKTVVLSSGYSNEVHKPTVSLVDHKTIIQPDEAKALSNIDYMVSRLKSANANVVLLGVADSYALYGGNGQRMNNQLAQIAQKNGVLFNGGFSNTKDNVHPSSYKLKSINLGIPTTQPNYDSQPIDPTANMDSFELVKHLRKANPKMTDNQVFAQLANHSGKAGEEIRYFLSQGSYDPRDIAKVLGLKKTSFSDDVVTHFDTLKGRSNPTATTTPTKQPTIFDDYFNQSSGEPSPQQTTQAEKKPSNIFDDFFKQADKPMLTQPTFASQSKQSDGGEQSLSSTPVKQPTIFDDYFSQSNSQGALTSEPLNAGQGTAQNMGQLPQQAIAQPTIQSMQVIQQAQQPLSHEPTTPSLSAYVANKPLSPQAIDEATYDEQVKKFGLSA